MIARAGYVLTGGRSSRFGRNKAFVEVGGRPMAIHVAERVRESVDRVALVGPADVYGDLGLRVVEDGVDDFGPAAGILAALEDTSAPWNLIVACDMPNVDRDLFEMLFRRAETSGADAAMPLASDGREQPLCAVYGKGAVTALRQAVDSGVSKVTRALRGVSIAYLSPLEYARIDPSGEMLLNVNRPEDLPRRG